ncbi:hypothetical protein BC941DRAFT_74853 [Chlamydoabsidia padenii]|nr:hypothetical protein BC941DRAFT_74853 [Chlamydoabsidia padenii]
MPKTLQHYMDTPSERFILATHVNRLRPTVSTTAGITTVLKTTNDTDTVNDNTIHCPCGDNDEDSGFTIQCEHCLTWQHGECVAIAPKDVPRHYTCQACQSQLPRQDHLDSKKQQSHLTAGNKRIGGFDKEHSRDINNNTVTTGQVENNKSNKKLRLKQRGSTDKSILDKRKQRCSSDDEDDEETVTPYDYSASSSPSTLNRRPSMKSTTYTGTGSRTSRASTRFEQVYRNIIRNKLVKQTMKEAHEQWQDNNKGGDLDDDKMVSVDASLLLPTIPKISVRPLWKSLSHGDPSVRKGVFAEIHVPENRFLLEINGEILIKSAYKCDSASLYPLLHTPEDHLFFYPCLDLLIDARHFGNDSRFVRRSCHPNAQVKCITLLHKNDDQTMHLGLFTCKEVDKGDEISIAWDWQRGTFLWKNYIQWKRQQPPPGTVEDQQVENMLAGFEKEFGECACQDKNECFVEYLKESCQSNNSKKPTQRRRGSDSNVPNTRSTTISGKRRRSKDHSLQQPTTQKKKQQKGGDTSNKINKRRTSTTGHNVSGTISMNTRNDLFFASLSTSRSTSPVLQHGKPSTTVLAEPLSDHIKKEVRLPCKKAWMKSYLAETTGQESILKTDILKKEVIDDFWNDRVMESSQPEQARLDDLVMDESMGDDSSTATLPLDREDTLAPQVVDTVLTTTDITNKPVKVSLKQYQSMQKKSIPDLD